MTVDIGGIRTNFRMPDVLALGLGGGSQVKVANGATQVGPRSLGYRLTEQAMVFGGSTLCATDLAVAAGYADIGDRSQVSAIPKRVVESGITRIHRIVSDAVERMKTSVEPLPLVLVGGGSVLIRDEIPGTSETVIPEYAGVANAIGASIAQVSGESDRIFSYDSTEREQALEMARQEARERAIEAGADPGSIEILNVEEVPLAYMPGGAVRVRVKVAGELGETL